jgi:hypothetical protein
MGTLNIFISNWLDNYAVGRKKFLERQMGSVLRDQNFTITFTRDRDRDRDRA